MVLHPTTESKSKLENCGVGVQRSMGTKKVEGPWHGHHGQLLKENYDPLKSEDFWGWGQTLGAHLILLPVFLLLSVSLAEIRLICGGAGHKGYDGDHNCIRSFFSQLFGAQLWRNIFGHNCALRASKATTVRGARV